MLHSFPMIRDVLLLLAGFAALYYGAEWLVRGAARLAFAMGVRPLVIGLTVVGFGTSMPEVVVSALASFQGRPDTALGNVVGSNIANTGLILALAALISPMKSDMGLLRREGPLMVAVTLGFCALAWTGVYTRWQGALMLAGLVAFVWASLRWSKEEPAEVREEFQEFEKEEKLLETGHPWGNVGWVVLGIVTLVAGGHFLVESAVSIARRFGIPEIVIATTLIAVGTSLPELATSIVAAMRRQADISIGNIVGSNIFNLLGVLGLSAVIRPVPIRPEVRDFEMVWMLAFAVATFVMLRTGRRISRIEGGLLLAGYAAFVFFLLR